MASWSDKYGGGGGSVTTKKKQDTKVVTNKDTIPINLSNREPVKPTLSWSERYGTGNAGAVHSSSAGTLTPSNPNYDALQYLQKQQNAFNAGETLRKALNPAASLYNVAYDLQKQKGITPYEAMQRSMNTVQEMSRVKNAPRSLTQEDAMKMQDMDRALDILRTQSTAGNFEKSDLRKEWENLTGYEYKTPEQLRTMESAMASRNAINKTFNAPRNVTQEMAQRQGDVENQLKILEKSAGTLFRSDEKAKQLMEEYRQITGREYLTEEEAQEKSWRDAVAERNNLMNNANFKNYSRRYQTVEGDSKIADLGSASRKGSFQRLYDAVNDGRDVSIKVGKGTQTLTLSAITEDQKKIFNYIVATEGNDAAEEYLMNLRTTLNEQRMTGITSKVDEFARMNEFTAMAASAGSVALAPVKGLAYAGQAYEYMTSGRIDPNSQYNTIAQIASTLRSSVTDEIEKEIEFHNGGKVAQTVGTLGYQTAMSMADFLVTMAVSSGLGAGAEALNLVNAANEISLAIMGTGAAAESVLEARKKGLSSSQAFAVGTIAGAAEIITEKVSIDALLNGDMLRDNAAEYLFKNMLSEGTEEIGSDLINDIAGVILLGDQSEWSEQMAEYQNQGMTKKEAFLKVFKETAIQYIESGLGGAISGAAMGGGAVAINYARQANAGTNYINADENGKTTNTKLGQRLSQATKGIDYQNENNTQAKNRIQQMIDEGLASDPYSLAYNNAYELQQKLDNGEVITSTDMGKQMQLNQAAYEDAHPEEVENARKFWKEIKPEIRRAERQAKITNRSLEAARTAEAQINNDQKVSKRTVNKILKSEAIVDRINATSEVTITEGMPAAEKRAVVESWLQNNAKEAKATQFVTDFAIQNMGEAGQDIVVENFDPGTQDAAEYTKTLMAFYGAGVHSTSENVNINDLNIAGAENISPDTAINAFEAGRKDSNAGIVEAVGGNNGGTNENGSGSTGWKYNVVSGKRTSSLSEASERRARWQENRDIRRRQIVDAVEAQKSHERLSSKELGLKDVGTDKKQNVVLERSSYTQELHDVEKMFKDIGFDTVKFVTDVIQVHDEKTNRDINVRGTIDFTNKLVVIQADNMNASVTQLARHEYMHALLRSNDIETALGLVKGALNRYGIDEADFERLADEYLIKYKWASKQKAYEELLCDAYAGINVFDYVSTTEGAATFEEAIRKMAKEEFGDVTSIDNAEGTNNSESEASEQVATSMTMTQCKSMIDRVFNLAGIRDFYDGQYKNADEWIRGEGVDEVAMYAENEYTIQEKFLDKIPAYLDGDITVEEILDAYLNNQLTGREQEKVKRIDVSKSSNVKDSRFYAPKDIDPADAKALYEVASQRVNNSNRDEVNRARAQILFLAHNANVSELLGMTAAEFNKKLKSWSRYPSNALSISNRINEGVALENRWTGIENCSILNKITVTDADIENMVKEVKGKSSEYKRQYVGRTMLALDTHIDWSGITFEFMDAGIKGALGDFSRKERLVRIASNGYAETVAHEMGHALDSIWGDDILGYDKGYLSEHLSDFYINQIQDPDVKQFAKNFKLFIESITDSGDIRNEYTQKNTETFARFVSRFVEFTDTTAGNSLYNEHQWYKDKFTAAQFMEFARLLQEKASIDARRMQNGNETQFSEAEAEETDSEGYSVDEDVARRFNESQVRNEDGDLLRVLHGSPETGITEFDPERAGTHSGASRDIATWFTDDRTLADNFSHEFTENNRTSYVVNKGAKGRVYEGYLNITNPFDFRNMTSEMFDQLWEMEEQDAWADRNEWQRFVEKKLDQGNHQFLKTSLNYAKLRDLGYDGVIARAFSNGRGDAIEYGIFSSDQFAAASNNIDNQFYSEADAEDIHPNMSDEDRTRVFKSKNVETVDVSKRILEKAPKIQYDSLKNTLSNTEALTYSKTLLKLLETEKRLPLNINEKQVLFQYSNGSLNESIHRQKERTDSFSDFADVLVNLEELVKNAQLIEQHSDKYKGTRREVDALKRMHVFVSFLQSGKKIIPVQIEGKEFNDSSQNKLYLTVSLNSIENGTVVGEHLTDTPAVPTFNLAQMLSNVNPKDIDFLKYIPDQLLNEEQLIGKREGINKEILKIAKYERYDGKVFNPEKMQFEDGTAENGVLNSEESSSDTELRLREENLMLKQNFEHAVKDLQKASDRIDQLEAYYGITDGVKNLSKNINRLTNRLTKDYASTSKDVKTATNEAIHDLLSNFFKETRNGSDMAYEHAKAKAIDIASNIVNNASFLANAEMQNEYTFLKTYLMDKSGIYISPADREDLGDYNAFRKRNFGKINLKNTGLPVDSAYMELQEAMGSTLFPDNITNPADQLLRIEEVMQTFAPVYDNPFKADMAEAIEYCANDIMLSLQDEMKLKPTMGDEMQLKLEETRQEGIRRAARIMEREKVKRDEQVQKITDYYKNQLELEKSKHINEEAKLESKYEDQKEFAKERKKEREMRDKLFKIARRLKNKKLPAANRALVEQYIGDLDTIAKSLTKNKEADLKALQEWYENEKATNEDWNSDPMVENYLRRLATKKINELSIDDVIELTETLQYLENEIKTNKKTIDTEDHRDIFLQADESIEDINNSRGIKATSVMGKLDKFFVEGTLSPIREMHRLVGYKDSSPLYQRMQEMELGQQAMLDFQRRAGIGTAEWTKNEKFIQSISGPKAKLIEIRAGVFITPAMRISLYLHSKNAQNMNHIMNGGVTIPNMEAYKKGELGEAYDQGSRTIKLSPSEVREITNRMPDNEKAFANAVSKYFNGMSQAEINATSEKLKGYSLAEVENYFPINTNSRFTKKGYDALQMDGTIEGMGFLKERVNAANPLYLRDVTDVLKQSIEMTSKYVGLAIPVRNFNKVYQLTQTLYDEEGRNILTQMKDEDLMKTKTLVEKTQMKDQLKQHRLPAALSLRETITQKWGSSALKYVDKLVTDLQNGYAETDTHSQMFNKIKSNYAGAVLTLNLSVAMKQAASYPTAAAVLGWGPLTQAMGNIGKVNPNKIQALKPNGRIDTDLIAKYTPLLWYRSQGFTTQELGDIQKNNRMNGMQKLLSKPVLNWIQLMDVSTTEKLWKASEIYVQQNNKSLTLGSDAYFSEVAKVYNRVITETQPNYTVMERPQLLRSNGVASQFMMFKTQPFQNFNVLYDAAGNFLAKQAAFKNDRNSTELKRSYQAAAKNLAWAISSQVVQTLVFAAMSFANTALIRGKWKKYKDKDDEITAWSVASGIGKDMISGMAAMIPFGSDFYEVLASMIFKDKYYGFENITASSINNIFQTFIKAGETVSGFIPKKNDQGEWEKPNVTLNSLRFDVDSIASSIAEFAGVPYNNVKNLILAGALRAFKIAEGKLIGEYDYMQFSSDIEKNKTEYYDMLFKAWMNHDKDYVELYNRMAQNEHFASSTKSVEENIADKMNDRLKKLEKVKKKDELSQTFSAPNENTENWYDEDQYQDHVNYNAELSQSMDEAVKKLKELPGYSDSDKATKERVQAAIDKMPVKSDRENAGLSETEMILFNAALGMVDEPTKKTETSEGGKYGTYTNDEVKKAIEMGDYTREQKAYLWDAAGKNEKTNPYR